MEQPTFLLSQNVQNMFSLNFKARSLTHLIQMVNITYSKQGTSIMTSLTCFHKRRLDTDIIFQMGKVELNSSSHVTIYSSHVKSFRWTQTSLFFHLKQTALCRTRE